VVISVRQVLVLVLRQVGWTLGDADDVQRESLSVKTFVRTPLA
jgi:hypothetical protein